MSSQTTVDNLGTRVNQPNISGGRSLEQTYDADTSSFKPKTLKRNYVLTHQPWDPTSLPPQYIPVDRWRWFPPMFCLGVPLTTREVCHLARYLGLTVEGDGDYYTYYTAASHLSQLCGFTGPQSGYQFHRVTVKVSDATRRPRMLSLVNNYQITHGYDYRKPFTLMTEALDGAFGGSKKLEWWLEYWLNHSPKNFHWVRLRPGTEWVNNWDETYDYED